MDLLFEEHRFILLSTGLFPCFDLCLNGLSKSLLSLVFREVHRNHVSVFRTFPLRSAQLVTERRKVQFREIESRRWHVGRWSGRLACEILCHDISSVAFVYKQSQTFAALFTRVSFYNGYTCDDPANLSVPRGTPTPHGARTTCNRTGAARSERPAIGSCVCGRGRGGAKRFQRNQVDLETSGSRDKMGIVSRNGTVAGIFGTGHGRRDCHRACKRIWDSRRRHGKGIPNGGWNGDVADQGSAILQEDGVRNPSAVERRKRRSTRCAH